MCDQPGHKPRKRVARATNSEACIPALYFMHFSVGSRDLINRPLQKNRCPCGLGPLWNIVWSNSHPLEFAKVWSEDPTWTPRLHERVSFRLLVPVGLPVAMFLLAATIAISLSRILLAVSKNGSVLIAIVAAVVILGACSWVAMRPRVTSSTVVVLAAAAVVSVAGAGITGVAAGEREFHPHEAHHEPMPLRCSTVRDSRASITGSTRSRHRLRAPTCSCATSTRT